MPFTAASMGLEIIIRSQSKQVSHDITGIRNLKKKKDKNELIYKTGADSETYRTNIWLPKGKGGGQDQEFGINRYTLLYIKQINNRTYCIAQGAKPIQNCKVK